jgi:hypothetical protein
MGLRKAAQDAIYQRGIIKRIDDVLVMVGVDTSRKREEFSG